MFKRMLLLPAIVLVSFSIFSACSSNKEAEQPANNNNAANEAENTHEEKSVKESDVDKSGSSSGEFEDQIDLKIGDTGQVETTLGKYEITIESIKEVEDIDGKSPMLDRFFIAEVKLKNIGDTAIDARDAMDNIEITEDLDGSGYSDYSPHFSNTKALTGTVEPGDSVSGQAVFEGYEEDTHYIRVVSGLLAAGAVKNDVRWTFTNDDLQ